MALVLGSGASAQTSDNIEITDIIVSPVNTEAQQLKIQVKDANSAARATREAAEAQFKEQRGALKESTEATRAKLQGERELLKSKAVESREGLQAERPALQENSEAIKVAREEFKQKADQARKEMKVSREEFKNKIEIQREGLKIKREEQKVELKNKLEIIKDERKKATVEKLDKRFDEINVKITTQWTNTLVRLEDLLVKISLRADKAATNGSDVSAVSSVLEKARATIVAARDAITVQVSKTYPIAVTSEAELRSAVAQTREKLNQDLKAVREIMRSTHQATVDVLTILKGVPKVDEASSSEASNVSQ